MSLGKPAVSLRQQLPPLQNVRRSDATAWWDCCAPLLKLPGAAQQPVLCPAATLQRRRLPVRQLDLHYRQRWLESPGALAAAAPAAAGCCCAAQCSAPSKALRGQQQRLAPGACPQLPQPPRLPLQAAWSGRGRGLPGAGGRPARGAAGRPAGRAKGSRHAVSRLGRHGMVAREQSRSWPISKAFAGCVCRRLTRLAQGAAGGRKMED